LDGKSIGAILQHSIQLSGAPEEEEKKQGNENL